MLARVSKVPVLVLVLVVAAGVGAVVALSTGGDAQSEVEARRGDAPGLVSALNRADDYGADVVRTYLRAALTCTPAGARVMAKLSRPGEATARKLFDGACEACNSCCCLPCSSTASRQVALAGWTPSKPVTSL